MYITEQMVDAAMRKAIEAGLLPRHACGSEVAANQELIRYILQAALETIPTAELYCSKETLRRPVRKKPGFKLPCVNGER